MIKKLLSGTLVLLFIVGCGPKQATYEQISELQEKRQSVETLNTQIKTLEQQKQNLQDQKAEKGKILKGLQAQKAKLEKNLSRR